MLSYQLKTAALSVRRNPILSGLLILAIGLGVAMSTAAVTVYYIYSGNPIPQKADRLFYVELDSWDAEEPIFPEKPDSPPPQITYRDMIELMKSDIPTYQSGMFTSYATVYPSIRDQRPFVARMRMCFGDFFPMFEVPFEYGGGWDQTADRTPHPVIVLDAQMNQKLFGGADSVGKDVRIGNSQFTVVGVLEPWRPKPRFYDPLFEGATIEPAGIFMPVEHFALHRLERGGAAMCHGTVGPTLEDFLQSECTWVQMWVQLDDRPQKEAYRVFLNAYVMDQKKLGRFTRPLNNRLLSVMALLRDREVVPAEARGILLISLLFLVVCSVNLIGILLGKFLAYAPEMGVRRAMGASRLSIFTQHLIECEVVGVAGGMLGIGLSVLVLGFVNRALDNAGLFQLDMNMIGAGIVLSVFAGAVAGVYPAWKICKIAPATHLKLQ